MKKSDLIVAAAMCMLMTSGATASQASARSNPVRPAARRSPPQKFGRSKEQHEWNEAVERRRQEKKARKGGAR